MSAARARPPRARPASPRTPTSAGRSAHDVELQLRAIGGQAVRSRRRGARRSARRPAPPPGRLRGCSRPVRRPRGSPCAGPPGAARRRRRFASPFPARERRIHLRGRGQFHAPSRPTGRRFAYVAVGREGHHSASGCRPLSASEARPIAGTEGARTRSSGPPTAGRSPFSRGQAQARGRRRGSSDPDLRQFPPGGGQAGTWGRAETFSSRASRERRSTVSRPPAGSPRPALEADAETVELR